MAKLANPQPRDRAGDIDVARGLGMVVVVLGHMLQFVEFKNAIFLFHMPLFFLLSGLMFKPRPVGAYTAQRAQALMVPYLAFGIIVLVLDNLLARETGVQPYLDWSNPSFFIPRLLFGGPLLVGAFTVFWFAGCLLLSSILFNAVANRWAVRDWRFLLVIAGCYAIAMVEPPGLKLPQGLAAVPLAMVFIWAGAMLAPLREKRALLIGLGLAVAAATLPFAGPFDMKIPQNGTFANAPLAIALSAILVSASFYIARIPYVAAALMALGRASLTIMFLHILVISHGQTMIDNRYLLLAAALLIPFLAHRLLEQSRFTQRFVLGRGLPPRESARAVLGASQG